MHSFAHSKFVLLAVILFGVAVCIGQDPVRPQVTPSGIRIGERLTYNMSFELYENVGYAETYAVSRGKLGDADALELHSKFKTTGIFSAAFFQYDESRTTFVGYESGAPLLVRRRDNLGASVRETVSNYSNSPAAGYDLLSLIYKSRQTAGSGSFNLVENDKNYSVTFQPQGAEHVRVDAGEFETTISAVQSEFLTEHGVQTMRIYYSTDEAHVPVLIKYRTTEKKDFRIALAGIQIVEPEVAEVTTPTPAPSPNPVITPRPTPTPYIENQQLNADLGFHLGEKLPYRISMGGRTLATAVIEAKERKLIGGNDSLILSATVTSAVQGNGMFSTGDTVSARVNPETLAPFEFNARMSGSLTGLTQLVRFDQKTGIIMAGPNRVDAPVGTHSLLSLLYAVRSFNLTPSKDARNPVNDTRVAVFWQDKAYIFMLRPFEPEMVQVNGQKIMAQKVSVKTNNSQLDQLGITIWLSMDPTRIPLMISFGPYQAELITQQTAVK
jgi:hypothetical protein